MNKAYITILFSLIASYTFAQKLPDVQKSAITAPANVKVDGKIQEWGDSYAAENNRTEILYTLANDEKNLYLLLKSTSTSNTNKILAGGITFKINSEGKKSDKSAQLITYPLIKRAERQQGGGRGQMGGQMGGGQQGGFQNRNQQSQQQRDSIQLAQRKTQLATVKEIKVSGFSAITDTLISIYNEHGIKTVGSFDEKGNYIFEMAIPLALIGNSVDKPQEFAYQIKVNGTTMGGFGGGNQGGGRPGGGMGNNAGAGGNFGAAGGGGRMGGGNFGGGPSNTTVMGSPTDFWGKYTPIKK